MMENNESSKCNKPGCFYCYEMNRPDKADAHSRKDRWTTSELAYLENNYKQEKIAVIEKVLNRSRHAIWYKAHKMRKMNTNELKSA